MTGPVLLVLAGQCPRAVDGLSHRWEHGDMAELVSFGRPDHGLTVVLGRCPVCTTPLLRVGPLTSDDLPDGPMYEARGAEL
jgi:hypothetical protein